MDNLKCCEGGSGKLVNERVILSPAEGRAKDLSFKIRDSSSLGFEASLLRMTYTRNTAMPRKTLSSIILIAFFPNSAILDGYGGQIRLG
jgi:hypothetical protein